MNNQRFLRRLCNAYLDSKQTVLKCGYENEILWQNRTQSTAWTETIFLREAAWVILSSGMREFVIRKIFPNFSRQFFEWDSADSISQNNLICRQNAYSFFKNYGKIDAIIDIAGYISQNRFETVVERLREDGANYLRQFSYLGPATSLHLAKNLGLEVAKPDRHLERIAKEFKFDSTHQLCSTISEFVGDDIAEVDLVLWRFATLDRNYLATLGRTS